MTNAENEQILKDKFTAALAAACAQVENNIPAFASKFPLPCTKKGVYPLGVNTDWTPGFYTGQCWLAYEATGKDIFRRAGLFGAASFAHRLEINENLDHHDLGFLYTPSCVAAHRLTGSESARKTALAAANRLTKRYQPKGKFIQAWGDMDNPHEHRLIIDCLLNVPLLWWAAAQTGDSAYSDIAAAHTATAAKTLFRPDGSTAHTCYINKASGKAEKVMTAQGYKSDSAWARGQAWGVLGMALAYRFTHKREYLSKFKAAADYFLARLSKDNIPYWDLVFTAGDEPRDSSAAAIAVCGIYEALPFLSESERKKYAAAADAMLLALTEKCGVKADNIINGGGVLSHGVYCKASAYNTVQDYGVDECNLWGDYFYMEALLRRTHGGASYWQTDDAY